MPQEERRHTQRRTVRKRARIQLDGIPGGLDCTIRNLSADGAKLELSGEHKLDKQVVVYFPTENIRIDASVIWQRDNHAGVAFARRLAWIAG